MKNINYKYSPIILFAALLLLLTPSCRRDDINELEPATFPTTAEIFIDGFSGGLNYAAFGGSDVTAFDVDTEVKYAGESSMKFAIPDAGSPTGSYAGGIFSTEVGRDLSGYDALTFWARGSQAATIDEIGFGNSSAGETYKVAVNGLAINTNWKKYIIPIPDPSKLTQERGMLFYAESPENEKGYTFWLDEVKFETIGRIAHPKPAILEGQDQEIAAETGDELPIGGTFSTFNLPTGVDMRVEVAPAYFNYTSSAPEVAAVSAGGVVSVMTKGETIITAALGDVAAEGSFKVVSSGDPVRPLAPAPTPTVPADKVISMFSNAYEDVAIDTWNTRWEFSTAEDIDLQIEGDDVKRYSQLNFVGIEFTSQKINASNMTHYHIDMWTPNPTDLPASFKVALIDFGPDGNFGGGDDSSHEISVTSPTLVSNNWVSIDVPLTDFSGLTRRANLAQMVFSGDLPTAFVDNIYFYDDGTGGGGGGGGGETEPTSAAPMPTQDAANVISIFSDSYDNVEGTDFFPDWGQATVVSQEEIMGNNTLVYSGLNYQGTQFASSINVSEMTHFHLDYWTANSSQLNAFLISNGGIETPSALSVPTSGWSSVDIPLEDFSPVDLADLIQFKFDGNGDIYLDNMYFYKDDGSGGGGGGDGTTPTVAAPMPTQAAGDVISIFSDAYTNLEGTDFFPDWGQATVVTQEAIAGNNTLVYSGLNYQGTQLANSLDASSMTHLHLDVWTANSTALNAFIISGGPVETAYALSVPTNGWLSVDIPLGDFAPVDLADIIQFKFDGDGDIYLDNIYFYAGDGGGGGDPTEPTAAAPTPDRDAGSVLSIFSDAYDNVEGTDFFPDWGQATVVSQVAVAGNNTLLYSGLNYQGTQFANAQDVSGMTHLHLDVWSANSTALNAFIISTGPTETAYALPVPTTGWLSIDIPLSEFSPVDLADVIQFKFDGDGDIYLDNMYFYSE
ncbi:MAG: carbohydrate binding domain-containing protein [Saprospiraceae bacterium]